ncbi:MAG: hypothetical protein AM325_012380 [Candidatus Thorarchaeota archaeon SMTZ1-45]
MMTVKLKDEYLRATSSSSEGTILIHKTPWVRILLDRDMQDTGICSIEVELSLPDSAAMGESASSDIIDQFSKHLEYLQKLRNFGFELSIIGSGCIYCASKVIQETPKDNLFSALLPP